MDNVENRLSKILTDAEEAVLKVLAEAAASGNYAAIDRARTFAEKLRDMNEGVDRKSGVADSLASLSRQVHSNQKKRSKARKKSGYPKYEFKNGSLYKLGWSKKKRAEYVHRVPVNAVKLICDALNRNFAGSSDPVSSEQILALEDLRKVGSPPSYQIYVVLAFLKDRGVVTSVGREGFRMPSEIAMNVDELLRKEEAA